jgi:hypothetical protein
MIKANELRLNCWFNHDGKPVQIDIETMEVLAGARNFEDYDPIPLTPEILEKINFEKWGQDDYRYLKNGFGFVIRKMSSGYYIWDKGGNEIKHLHQLQNLYFCFCGEELNIEL